MQHGRLRASKSRHGRIARPKQLARVGVESRRFATPRGRFRSGAQACWAGLRVRAGVFGYLKPRFPSVKNSRVPEFPRNHSYLDRSPGLGTERGRNMDEPTTTAFVERLFAKHRTAVQAFFYRRLRTKSDAPDLAQEVYLRLLRVSDSNAILNLEAYLYTVASNLLKENAAADGRGWHSSVIDATDRSQLPGEWPAPDVSVDALQRVDRLRTVLRQLPPKCRAAVVLQYRYGLSYEEIGTRLKVSPHMVKKYLRQGLNHCRRRMARLG
jgi:RNA polymerase sigma factor (sigma-70 family)